MKRLEGKVAIVTGSTSGIGRAIAVMYADHGAKVIVVGRNSERGGQVVNEIIEAGGEAIFCKTDILAEEDHKKMVETAVSTYGKLDILVNNAGTSECKSIEESTLEEWNYVFATNVNSIFISCKYAIPYLKQTKGSIITISSMSALKPVANLQAYSTSKAAASMLTKNIAFAYAADGVRANVICPGIVQTPMNANVPPQVKESVAKTVPLQRLGEPEDIAGAALYLASDESIWVTGQSISVDGGMTNM